MLQRFVHSLGAASTKYCFQFQFQLAFTDCIDGRHTNDLQADAMTMQYMPSVRRVAYSEKELSLTVSPLIRGRSGWNEHRRGVCT